MRATEEERVFLAAEARALAEALAEGDGAASYRRLAEAAEAGSPPDELDETVGSLVALCLETGRARGAHGPAGVRALASLWRKTPQGRAVVDGLDELNTALSVLRGLPVNTVRVGAVAPGAFSIAVSAGDYEARLVVDRAGLRLRSLNVGGGGIGE